MEHSCSAPLYEYVMVVLACWSVVARMHCCVDPPVCSSLQPVFIENSSNRGLACMSIRMLGMKGIGDWNISLYAPLKVVAPARICVCWFDTCLCEWRKRWHWIGEGLWCQPASSPNVLSETEVTKQKLFFLFWLIKSDRSLLVQMDKMAMFSTPHLAGFG